MTLMSKLGGALLDCISKPIDVLCDWASEPLKAKSHERDETSKNSEHKRNMEIITAQSRSEHEIRVREMELAHELNKKDKEIAYEINKKNKALAQEEKELDVNLEIRRVTEIERAAVELQEWKKEKEFERMERTTAAIAHYLKQLTILNVETINAIGHMQLELKERAQQLVYEKTFQYKELQDIAINDAMNDILKIEEKFGSNERAKDILMKAVDTKLGNIIDTSTRFLEELNRDIVNLNESIDRLTQQGQKFIESHLDRFHISDSSTVLSIADASSENITHPPKYIN
ncbi:hypothetical protein [Aeromonas caviae]|uniref:hypothetical protein n=2 Tax=Aeromonadaceae TaxID=84642 RepID=UPI0029DA4F0C|nr:hypothetical protein [Aeromonas caviae]MDX7683058.1 hypothetical protein [Aeromonas caviae]